MSQPVFDFERDYNWFGLVASCGDEARHWLEVYKRTKGDITSRLAESLSLLRDRQMDRGKQVLEAAQVEWSPLQHHHPSVFYVLGRFYFGTLAYYHYCMGDLDIAELLMDKAKESISLAVEANEFLLPFSALCLDTYLKKVQISRARRRWDEMRYNASITRAVVADTHPLCSLRNGAQIYHVTLRRFLTSEPSADLGPAIQYLSDAGIRMEFTDLTLANLYKPRDLLIPYP